MSHQIFGPVPSRRLGFSLGVDIIPFKTCTLDCIYCQLGRTTNKSVERKKFFSTSSILNELKKTLKERKQKIDYITFSGSGEPTLNLKIGDMIEGIKKITSIPVAVLTNSTLLSHSEVQEEIKRADLVVPSLDAPDEETFQKINRPHSSLCFDEMLSGIIDFSQKFRGKIWLEIMLIKGINDSPDKVEKLAQIVKKIKLDKIQLNTPVRPPAEEFVHPLSLESLKNISSMMGERCEIVTEIKRERQRAYEKNREEAVLNIIKRRPVTVDEISSSLGLHKNEVIKYVETLGEKNLIKFKIYNRRKYYY